MLIQVVLLSALTAALLLTWRRARQQVISRLEALTWSAVWAVAGAAVVHPETTTSIARYLGVGRGVDLVLYGSVLVLFLLVFKIFVALSSLERKLTQLVRQDAMRGLTGTARSDTQVPPQPPSAGREVEQGP